MEILSAGILHLQEIDILYAGLRASSQDKLKNTLEGKNCLAERNERVMGEVWPEIGVQGGGQAFVMLLSFRDFHFTPKRATQPTQDTDHGSSFSWLTLVLPMELTFFSGPR